MILIHVSLSVISLAGKGDGSPLQCSCLENPRVGGAWWAAVSGVAQSGLTAAAAVQKQPQTEHKQMSVTVFH